MPTELKKNVPSGAKRIALNTGIIYARIAISTIIALVSTRYVLIALGASDFGLFNVVGSFIAVLNCISTAMYTTTRRYVNIEQGKSGGNVNKIFNICLSVHIAFALFIFFICETVGILYINNYLNVAPDKLADAHFVFQVSTIIAAIGITNVPYQALIESFEKFWQTAAVDIVMSITKLIGVILLVYYSGNALRMYSLIVASMTLLSFVLYRFICKRQWSDIIRFKIYKDKTTYKELLVFNNYTALGAASWLGKYQGSNVLVNLFFGTVVNATFAIANQVNGFVSMLVNNLNTASAPQVTQKYGAGQIDDAVMLCSRICRLSILIMICIFFPLFICLETLLPIWLKEVPGDTLLYCRWILISALCGSLSAGIPNLIQATGKIKWFQIIGSISELAVLPLCYYLFSIGYPAVTIIVAYSILTICYRMITFWMMYRIVNLNSILFIKRAYMKPFVIIAIMSGVLLALNGIDMSGVLLNFSITAVVLLITLLLCFFIGLENEERTKLFGFVKARIKAK